MLTSEWTSRRPSRCRCRPQTFPRRAEKVVRRGAVGIGAEGTSEVKSSGSSLREQTRGPWAGPSFEIRNCAKVVWQVARAESLKQFFRLFSTSAVEFVSIRLQAEQPQSSKWPRRHRQVCPESDNVRGSGIRSSHFISGPFHASLLVVIFTWPKMSIETKIWTANKNNSLQICSIFYLIENLVMSIFRFVSQVVLFLQFILCYST